MRLLPFEYAVRNLGRSRTRLIASILGAALVCALIITGAAFVRAMESSLTQSSSPDNVMLLGAGSEESIERSELAMTVPGQAAASIPGVKTRLGAPFVSPEVHMAMPVGTSAAHVTTLQIVWRGVTPAAFLVHPQIRITEGRAPQTGRDEILVGALAAAKLGLGENDLAIGKSLWFDARPWKIVGHFTAPHTVMDGEIWAPLASLQLASRRDTLSCVVITLDKGVNVDIVDIFVKTRTDLELSMMREQDYYAKLAAFYLPIRIMAWVTAALVALAGLFGGLHTMHAAFASRVREAGMLRTVGFSRRAIIWSFTQESVLASAAGALLGGLFCLIALDKATLNVSMGVFQLNVDGAALAMGLGAGLILGLIGAAPAAMGAMRITIPQSLKAI